MKKICKICGIEKNISEFYKYSKSKDGFSRMCKTCQKIKNQESQIKNHGNKYSYFSDYRRKQTAMGKCNIIFSKKKHNAKRTNIPFTITFEEFEKWYNETEKKCYYCGIKLEDIEKNRNGMPGANKAKLTLDRKENTGYHKNNIVFACSRCNLIKSNFFSSDEMKEIGEKYVKPKWN